MTNQIISNSNSSFRLPLRQTDTNKQQHQWSCWHWHSTCLAAILRTSKLGGRVLQDWWLPLGAHGLLAVWKNLNGVQRGGEAQPTSACWLVVRMIWLIWYDDIAFRHTLIIFIYLIIEFWMNWLMETIMMAGRHDLWHAFEHCSLSEVHGLVFFNFIDQDINDWQMTDRLSRRALTMTHDWLTW